MQPRYRTFNKYNKGFNPNKGSRIALLCLIARARTDYTEPEIYKQAINDAYKRFKWELAMGDKYESLMKN